ncbi:hypothetical protein CCZ01_08485 [Helicobacter monodelphidis]|nr:hypothetical protein CCZ01_08485 [Helicobacter sp. 15-1451]
MYKWSITGQILSIRVSFGRVSKVKSTTLRSIDLEGLDIATMLAINLRIESPKKVRKLTLKDNIFSQQKV